MRKAERAPVRVRGGERLTAAGLAERLGAASAACEALAQACDVARLRDEIDRVDLKRRDHAFWADTEEAGRVLAGQTRALETVTRIERLQNQVSDLARALEKCSTRADIAAMGEALPHAEERVVVARRELVTMGADGFCDALVDIMPVGPSSEARDFLFGLYRDWAKERRIELAMLHEPVNGDEPIALLLRGPYAYGYLVREAGHHRLRNGERASAARITVAPLTDRTAPVEFTEQRPLKAVGRLGGKIKSRVAIAGIRLVLQNERNLSQNRELARDVAPSWPRDAAAEPPRVRRYDLDPFLVRDYLTGADFTRKDILSPKPFHQLLCDRIDTARRDAGDAQVA
jgi:peptide chain release factor 2